jgi:hypothetical protein
MRRRPRRTTYVQAFLARHGGLVSSVKLDMGAYGAECPKATVLLGTAPYLSQLERRLGPVEKLACREARAPVRCVCEPRPCIPAAVPTIAAG